MNDRMIELVVLLSIAGVFFAWRWWTVWRVGKLRKSLAQALENSQKQLPPPESENVVKAPPGD